MIRALRVSDGEVIRGGVEQLAEWRQQGGLLWLDLFTEDKAQERQFLGLFAI